jgi:hypothetical protein
LPLQAANGNRTARRQTAAALERIERDLSVDLRSSGNRLNGGVGVIA